MNQSADTPRTWHFLRLYYKSMPLFRALFRDWYRAWFYPFLGRESFIPRNGAERIWLPRKYWTMLPTAARLAAIGAKTRWDDGHMRVSYGGMEFVAPWNGKMMGQSVREVFIDDAYRVQGRDLTGKVVLDVGAYIGDSSLAFALRGARVHAFEPIMEFHECLAETMRLNGCADKVVLHAVGLADKDAVGPDGMRLVDAFRYLDEQHIDRVNILKLDCEGCEYELLRDDRLLKRLQPDEIVLEYHRGGADLYRFLLEHGYSVEWPEREDPVGYLYARAAR